MGMVDSFKKWLHIEDEEDDDFVDDDFEMFKGEKKVHENEEAVKSNRVVSIPLKTQFQVILVKPDNFEDARSIADHLNEKKTVVLNLESTSKDISRRLVDFLCGVAYANGGQMKKVANNTFIITPYNVDVMGDLIDELESNGMFFGS